MIAAVSWVPKGASKAVPDEAQLPSKEEIEEMIKSGGLEEKSGDKGIGFLLFCNDAGLCSEHGRNALGKTSKKNSEAKLDDIADGLKELDMDHYDDEDEGVELFSRGIGDLYYPSNQMDPHLKDKDDEDSEDLEDLVINANDAVIVCARNEDDVSHLEARNAYSLLTLSVFLSSHTCMLAHVHVYEESNDGDVNLYVHHHIIIPAFPLCMAWLDCPVEGVEKGNFMAVGSMEPSIEIWDLDIIEEVQPCLILGGIDEEKKMKRKKKKKGKKSSFEYKEGSHTDSVLGLAWNKEFRYVKSF
ncbi:hypothetical protein Patl1_28209 [Pistacia atlantica]|uniref:Uncharacterized protein n=1 Tax=Pistacia atlantica TaxID=434234 RepID=A0ACC1BEU0_9ROSI|nr:hypothetical protein Patl1_28209 [Pistacia atlantica]